LLFEKLIKRAAYFGFMLDIKNINQKAKNEGAYLKMVRRLSGHVVEINQMRGSVHHRKDDGRTRADLVELKQLKFATSSESQNYSFHILKIVEPEAQLPI
jgi:hypothetical protein